jgi:hypothetical protein
VIQPLTTTRPVTLGGAASSRLPATRRPAAMDEAKSDVLAFMDLVRPRPSSAAGLPG